MIYLFSWPEHFLSFLSFIIFLNFTLFYLDDFKLSENKFLRYLQILIPIWLLFLVVIFFYLNILTFNQGPLFLHGAKNISNTVNVCGSVEVNRDSAQALARNIGFAGTSAGIAVAVGKAISKSSLSQVQKAGIVIACGLAGAGIHLVGSNLNRVINRNTTMGDLLFQHLLLLHLPKLILLVNYWMILI